MTEQQPRMNPLPKYYSFTEAQLQKHDHDLRVEAIDSVMRALADRGRLLPEGKPVSVKRIERDGKGQIIAIVEEQITAHDRGAT